MINKYFKSEIIALRTDKELIDFLSVNEGIVVLNVFMDQIGRYKVIYNRFHDESLSKRPSKMKVVDEKKN